MPDIELAAAVPPVYTATSPYYVVNALELPANQTAAAIFLPTGIVDTTKWATSPMNIGGSGVVMPSFPDVATATRKTTAQAALNAEAARLTTTQTGLTAQQTAITNLLAL